jgi:hypothetical protein
MKVIPLSRKDVALIQRALSGLRNDTVKELDVLHHIGPLLAITAAQSSLVQLNQLSDLFTSCAEVTLAFDEAAL